MMPPASPPGHAPGADAVGIVPRRKTGDIMAKRIILRIELTQQAKDKLQAFAEHAGMTQYAISSRLVEWFAEQPETIQSAVLRRYPSEIEIDVASLLLKRIAKGKKAPSIKRAGRVFMDDGVGETSAGV